MERVALAAASHRATQIQSVWRGFVARKRARVRGQLMLREEEILEGVPLFLSRCFFALCFFRRTRKNRNNTQHHEWPGFPPPVQ